jgi:hypothetical protein
MLHTPGQPRGPITQQERLFYTVFLLIMLGLFTGEVCTNYEPVKLSVLLFVLFWAPLLVLHEAAHAVVAALVGWQVETIVIGMGAALAQFKLGRVDVEVRVVPLEGFVRARPRNLTLPSLKHALIYFAGPGIELVLAGLILWAVGPDKLLTRQNDYVLIAWQSLAAASATGAVLNLFPHGVQTASGMIPNDGLGIILCLMRPASAYAGLIQTHPLEENQFDHREQFKERDLYDRHGLDRDGF